MTSPARVLFGFHAVTARIRHAPKSVQRVWFEATRRDRRMLDFLARTKDAGIEILASDSGRLTGLAGTDRHQGVVAAVDELRMPTSIDDVLDELVGPPLLLVLDSITDPRNLGACLRVADGAGVHAVIAPKDRAVGVSAIAAKTASGAAESVPFITVTNLTRTLRELKDERDIRVVGTADEASPSLYASTLTGPLAIVMGAEDEGLRRLVRETCDELVHIPMAGVVESLNVSVAAAVCLFEVRRQRLVRCD